MEINQNQSNTQPPVFSDIESLDNFQKKHSDIFTRAQLTWFLRNRERNGLGQTGAVILSARKFYINVPLFCAWFAAQKA